MWAAEESPRPMPQMALPSDSACSVASAEAVTADVAGDRIGDAGAELQARRGLGGERQLAVGVGAEVLRVGAQQQVEAHGLDLAASRAV